MGSVKKVLASLLTDSGQVAETESRSVPSSAFHRQVRRCERWSGVLTHDGLPPGFLLGTEPDDLSDIVLEPLIQHSIGFVQDEVLYAIRSLSSFE